MIKKIFANVLSILIDFRRRLVKSCCFQSCDGFGANGTVVVGVFSLEICSVFGGFTVELSK